MNPIALTEEQRRLIDAEPGRPIDLIDLATSRTYVLLPREQYDRAHNRVIVAPIPAASDGESAADLISPGILHSQQTFWRDLTDMLHEARNLGKWVCYHGGQRLAMARTQRELIRECVRRKISADAYYMAVIEPREFAPWEVEEVESLGTHNLDDRRYEN